MLPCLSVGASLLYNLQVELTSRLLVIMSAESRNAEAACLARYAIWCRLSHLLLPSLGGLKSRSDHVPWWVTGTFEDVQAVDNFSILDVLVISNR